MKKKNNTDKDAQREMTFKLNMTYEQAMKKALNTPLPKKETKQQAKKK